MDSLLLMNVEGENKPPCLCFINSVKQVERVMGSWSSRQEQAKCSVTSRSSWAVGQGRPNNCLPLEFYLVSVQPRPRHETKGGEVSRP